MINMKTLFFTLFTLIPACTFCQKVDFTIINSTYLVTDKEISIDIKIENNSRDTVFIINPNHYFQNEYVNQLWTEPITINIYYEDKCETCGQIAMEGDMEWYKDFSLDYILIIPPKDKIDYTVKKDFGHYSFNKEGSYKVKLEYDFSEDSYSINKSKERCNNLFKKMSSLSFADSSEVIIK